MRKPSEKARAKNERVEAALKEYLEKKFKSVTAAAKAHDVPEATLRARVKGRKSRAEAKEEMQLLAKAEEDALVRWILDVSKAGYPPRKPQVREIAEQIRRERVSKINDASITLVEYPPIGDQWVDRFIQRHPSLQTAYARRIDASRIKETTVDAVMRWLNTVRETIEQYDVAAKDIYNMDESGFAIGSTQGACVVIDSRIRSQFQARPGRQEWVTVIECICGDGSVINPLVIFCGMKLSSEWLISPELTKGWRFSCTKRGWTSDVHGLEWLRRCFEPETREKANGGWRILILDGHGSHVTLDFMKHCRDHKIILLRLVPHTSHLCQPLDVGLFGPLKSTLSAKLEPLFQTEVSRIRKSEWLTAFAEAREDTFSESNVLGGWRGAGLLPFDPDKVLRHIVVVPPPENSAPVAPASTSPMHENSSLDPDLFNSSLLTSSPLNTEAFRRTASALRAEVQQKKVLATPVRQLIPRLTTATERLHAENSILKTRLKAATDVLAARKEQKKGTRVTLKDQLLLTTDEVIAAVERLAEEKKKRVKKTSRQGRKRKAQEVESESEDNSSHAGSDYAFPSEILDCIVVE